MPRNKKVIPKDVGAGDYYIAEVSVEKKPKIEFSTNKLTGEIEPRLVKRENPIIYTITVLLDPKGFSVIPVSMFIRHLANNGLQIDTLHSHARGLLAFYRWMKIENKTIYDCSDIKEEGVVYGFRDFLCNNLKHEVVNKDGSVQLAGMYMPNTCKSYVLTIVRFFEFLHVERIIRLSDKYVPFEYQYINVRRKSRGVNNHDILGHIKKSDHEVSVTTTGLTNPFGKTQSTPSHHKLTPMDEEEKDILYKHLRHKKGNFRHSFEVKDLMIYVATETGLRLEELVTFPLSVVRHLSPEEDVVKVAIGEIINGCKTKYDKQRTIEISRDVMEELLQYKESNARKVTKRLSPVNHNSLFLNLKNGLPFNTNTIQTYYRNIRENIKLSHPDWYFTIHDSRSTFATHWLYNEHNKRGVIFNVLLDELSLLMGHKDTATTEKYIKYMDTESYWLKFALKKNRYIHKIME